MKKSVVIIVLLLLFPLLSIVSAKSPKYKIWVNSKVECCGVKEPVKNLEWLKAEAETKFDFLCVMLLKNNATQEYCVLVHGVNGVRTGMYLVAMNDVALYDCNGVKLDRGAYFNGKSRYDLYKNSVTIQDGKLNKRIEKVNKRYNKMEKKLEKARVKITESAPNLQPPRPCESCEEFLKDYNLVDIITYSYAK